MRRTLSQVVTATFVVATLALTGTAVAQTASGTNARPRGVVIDNDAYYPSTIRAMPGASIAVTNAEGEDHSLTARDGSFNTGIFESGTKYITAPNRPGRYQFSCLVHGPAVMKGVLIVGG